jgi:hypothetical protein
MFFAPHAHQSPLTLRLPETLELPTSKITSVQKKKWIREEKNLFLPQPADLHPLQGNEAFV